MQDFDETSVIEEARAQARLEDFGDEGFREPLRMLLRSLDKEADLNEVGRATQHARIVASLTTRLQVADYLRRHPEIDDEDLGDPVVIVGLARTGTTMLHRLLASAPGFKAPLWWECRFPAPFPGSPGSDWRRDDPRIPAAHEEVRLTLEAVPVLAAVHPWDAEGADEEVILLEHSFLSHVPESSANLPSYRAWLDEQDLAPAYAYLKRLLRFLQWQRRESGRPVGGRWVLKSPVHLGSIDTLFEAFPGARVIQTHRDPLETIPSAASMYRALWALHRDVVDAHEVGRQVCDRYRRALERCMTARERHDPGRFFDAPYRETVADPLAQVRRIYDWLGEPLTPEAERAMRQWTSENARGKRPPHEYALEDFGYSESALAQAFAPYRRRHLSKQESAQE